MKKWIPILCILLLFFLIILFQRQPENAREIKKNQSTEITEQKEKEVKKSNQPKKKRTSKRVSVSEKIVFHSRKTEDPNLMEGEVFVQQEGKVGEREKVIEITYEDGVEVSRKIIQTTIKKEPIDEILVVGTKKGVTNHNTVGNSSVVFFSYEQAQQWAESLLKEAKSTELGEKVEGGYGGYIILPIIKKDPSDGKEKQAYTIEWY